MKKDYRLLVEIKILLTTLIILSLAICSGAEYAKDFLKWHPVFKRNPALQNTRFVLTVDSLRLQNIHSLDLSISQTPNSSRNQWIAAAMTTNGSLYFSYISHIPCTCNGHPWKIDEVGFFKATIPTVTVHNAKPYKIIPLVNDTSSVFFVGSH